MRKRSGLLTVFLAVSACSTTPINTSTDSPPDAGGSADPPDGSDHRGDAARAVDHDAGSPAARHDAGQTRDATASRDGGQPKLDAAAMPETSPVDSARDVAIDAGSDASDAGPPTPYVDFSINHLLATGQSNCVSNAGAPPLSLMQPFANLSFDTGLMHMGSCDGIGCTVYKTPAALAPLVDGDEFFSFPTETVASGAANEITFLAQQEFGMAAHNVMVTMNGRSGNTLYCLRKGGCPYQASTYIRAFDQGLMDVQNAKALADAAGRSYVVRGVMIIHGESDHYDYTSGFSEFPLGGTDGVPNEIKDYGQGLMELQRDYQTSIQAITGQTEPVILFVSGISGWTDTTTSLIPTYQLQAHVNAPGKVILVTPGYPMQVYMDCEHYNDYGERRLGEYFAKAYVRTILGGHPWEQVLPRTITRNGAILTVEYYVPTPPLVFDTTRVVESPNYGFTFVDNGNLATISSVALTGPTTVKITLAAAPTGPTMALRYGQNEPPSPTGCIGPGTVYSRSASGNLRDSDTTPSYYKDANGVPYDLFDWGVIYELPVQ